jgi:hypothetical protein
MLTLLLPILLLPILLLLLPLPPMLPSAAGPRLC